MNLIEKTAIISGVGARLGIEIVKLSAENGANLALGDIDASSLSQAEALADSLGAPCRPQDRYPRPRGL
jgi:NAD(P)-dependent dehydrogenase (short-subunit alcohol dehydrogenase family)